MSDLVVTCVQSIQYWEDKLANQKHYDELLATSNLEKTDVLLFPEMFHTGFSMQAEKLAEQMDNSEGIQWLKEKAAQLDCLVITSLIIEAGAHYYNRMVASFPNGDMSWYDKNYLFSLAGEDQNYTAGTTKTIVPFRGWKINLQICYDLRFPESCRNGLDQDGETEYDLLVYVANWPTRRISHWDVLLPARAVENQCYAIGVNRVGKDGNGIEYDGHSMVVNPMGEIEAIYERGEELVFQSKLSLEKLNQTRQMIPFLKDKK
jgi:omega-amidase